ncbi:opacity protein-like surface antigen [Sinobacterium caligoides]|uniref:Opacity protein-like surface antigen n=1 Tax=Sinobacterium caligoides TaxID=933926 RepID=A0A3N2DKR2_9GAMM|nr:outer membrane beta-barrel protein [Sinobacterium caligoides]ROS00269.1 opacity protein-like surface antigen [Sinobacterium caligoides]
MHKLLGTLVISSAFFASAAALADAPKFYASAAISYADQDFSTDYSSTIGHYDYSDKAVGFNLTGGYQFNDYFALEASYYDFGNAEDKRSEGDFHYKAKAEASALGLAAVASYPITDSLKVYGKLGAAYFMSELTTGWQVTYNDEVYSSGNSDKDSGFAPYFGAGVALNVTGSSEVYLESSKFSYEASSDMGDYDHDVINTSLGYRMFF